MRQAHPRWLCIPEFGECVFMRFTTLALENNRPVPGQAMAFQAAGNGSEASFIVTRWIDIVDTQVPFALM